MKNVFLSRRLGHSVLVLSVATLLAIALLALTGGSPPAALAATGDPDDVLYVTPSGLASGDCQRQPINDMSGLIGYNYGAACTLAHALSIAADGDVLWLTEGTYNGSIVISRNLTLEGGFRTGFVTTTTTADPVESPDTFQTFLVGANGQPTIRVESVLTTTARTVRLAGMRIRHDSGQSGEGILLTRPAASALTGVRIDLTLEKVIVLNNQATGAGGGLAVDASAIANISATTCQFLGNTATSGGGMSVSAGTAITLNNCLFLGNTATSGHGGGLSMSGATLATLNHITFTANLANQDGGGLYGVDSPVTLSGGSVISNGAGFPSGTGLGGGFYLSSSGSPTTAILNKLTLTNNQANGNGGGLYATNTNVTINSTQPGPATGNKANSGSGGALYITGGSATLGTFNVTGNQASTHGGGIYVDGSGLTLSGSQVATNTATSGSGGGIYVVNGGTVGLTGLTLINNQAGQQGGALYLDASSATVSGSPSIRNNRAGSGGAAYITASNATVSISNNSVVRQNQANAGSGGAFYVLGQDVTLDNNTFLTNTATVNGGGIVLSDTVTSALNGNIYRGNTASADGGALYLYDNPAVTLDVLSLTSNTATQRGGGLYTYNSSLTVNGAVTFTTNQAGSGGGAYLAGGSTLNGASVDFRRNNATQQGGALALDASTVAISGAATIISNTATTNGGGVYLTSGGSAAFGATELRENKASLHGGGVYASGGSLSLGATQLFSNTTGVQGMTATPPASGGGMYLATTALTVTGALDAQFNKAAVYGGALVADSAAVTVTGAATIISNTAVTGSGGGVYAINGGSFNVGGALTVQQNLAQIDGGGIMAGGASLTFGSTSTIISNTATTGNGGGLNLNLNAALDAADTLTLRGNKAQVNGGGLYFSQGTLNWGVHVVDLNTAVTGSGGGIYFANNLTAHFGAQTLDNNTAAVDGGGLYAVNSALFFDQPATAQSNTAATGSGGGYYLSGGISSTWAMLTLAQNLAQVSGGGIYANGVDLFFGSGTDITQNQAMTEHGGGVYSLDSAVSFAQVDIANNQASLDGGGLYLSGGSLALADNSTVNTNTAGSRGGGIYLGGSGDATLGDMTMNGNQAQTHGGGLYMDGGNLTVNTGVTISSNMVQTGSGGGVYVADGDATFNGVQLTSNQSYFHGGGIYLNDGSLTMQAASAIASNTVMTGSGGGIAVVTGTVTIDASAVEQNNAYTHGGGLYATGADVTVQNGSTVASNSVITGSGGGIYVTGTALEVSGSSVADNESITGGGGLYADTLLVRVLESSLTGNNGGGGHGGGAYLTADVVRVHDNTISDNETAGNGGGVALVEAPVSTFISNTVQANTVRLDVTTVTTVLAQDVVIENTGQVVANAGDTIVGTDSSEGTGAGLHVFSSTAVFTGNIILGNENESGEGGGIFMGSSAVSMTNNVVAQNSVAISDSYGAGIYVINSRAKLVHTTVADNANVDMGADSLGIGIYVTKGATETSSIELLNNIIAGHEVGMMLVTGNTAAMHGNAWNNTGLNWDGPGLYQPVTQNTLGDMAFVNRVAGDYRIQRQSAAFDAGSPLAGVAFDILGTPRPRAFGVDAGAYEQFYVQGIHMRASANPQFVNSGDTIEYTVELVNHSTVVLNNVSVNFALPAQQSLTSSETVGGGDCAGTSCNFGNLPVGSGRTIILRATASGTPPAQGFIEMVTNITASGSNFVDSDTQIAFTSRLQRCLIRYDGQNYGSIQQAIDAVNATDDTPDIVRVNGYCGGSITINKKLTLQGGWNADFTVLTPTSTTTTIDAANTGRVLMVVGDISPVVENFTLRRGSASGKGGGPSGKDAGGLVYIQNATVTIRNVRMTTGSSPDYGGGVYVERLSAPIIENSIIESSSAGSAGGGLYANESSPQVINTIIRNNSAKAGGGAYLRKGEAKLIDCTIANNNATGTASYLQVAGFNVRLSQGGGGGVNFDESKAGISGCLIENNSARAGGAVFADNSPASVTNSTIRNNRATASPSLVQILILANTAGGGGAFYGQRSDMVIEHNVIVSNTAPVGGAILLFNGTADGKINDNFIGFNEAGKGSAVYVHLRPDVVRIFLLPITLPDFVIPFLLGLPQPDAPKVSMQLNTIAHNRGGTTVHVYGDSAGEMISNIIAFNTGTGVVAETEVLAYIALIPVPIIFVIPIPFPVFYVPSVSTEFNLFYQNGGNTSEQGVGASVSTSENIEGDPAFKDDGYHIKRISAAYNMGKNVGIAIDLDNDSRPQADRSEMGADEYPAIGVRYVSPTGGDTGGNLCRDFLNPCNNLQTAIDSAQEGDLIKMAGGTYSGVVTRNGTPQMGLVTKTLTIQGGYFPTISPPHTDRLYTQNDWEDPHPDVNPTVLDAGGAGRVIYILDQKRVDQEGNPIEVEPTLSGLIIQNGSAAGLNGPQGNAFSGGGAIIIDDAKAVITDVVVADSTAAFGGGIYVYSSTLTLGNVTVRDNVANECGGGFYLENSDDATIEGILIDSNSAKMGGGMCLEDSDATIRLNQISGNMATESGGGMYIDTSAANVISNTVTGNNAGNGGGFYVQQSQATIRGNTVSSNGASAGTPGFGFGGGFYLAPGEATVRSNIVELNTASAGAGLYLNQTAGGVIQNQISNNTAILSGGGVYFLETSDAAFSENAITDNIANGTGENDGGGGLYLESSVLSVQQNTLTGNRGMAGGGAYLFSFSNANLAENTITDNIATRDGGGIYVKLSNANITMNTVTGNDTSSGSGGGVYVKLSGAIIAENTINENDAAAFGGGVFLDESGATLRMSSLRDNHARNGGGVYVLRSNTAVFDDVTIEENRADNDGGGIFILLSDIVLEAHRITGNEAGQSGGGIFLSDSSVALARNVLNGNEAGETGGGITLSNGSDADMSSNAIIDNVAGNTGSGIFVRGSSPNLAHTTIARNSGGDGSGLAADKLQNTVSVVTMINTIVAGQDVGVRATAGSTVTLQATLWDGNQLVAPPGANNVLTGTADLNFFGPANFEADGYHVQKGSRAINVGLVTAVSLDVDGDGRPQGGAPELGADELVADCAVVVYDDPDIVGGIVYNNVQAAIDAAEPSHEVRISGTCVGANERNGTMQLAYVNKNITVRGGYTPTNWITSYPISQPTFLDAMGQGRVVFVAQNVNPALEDLNLLNGSAQSLGGGPGGLDAGGGIYVRNASPTLRRVTVTGGGAYYGAGIYLQGGAALVVDSMFDSGTGTKGGGIFLRNSNATLRNNSVRTNVADDGGGVFLSFSQPIMEDNQIVQNSAQSAGGGMFLESSAATIRSNLIATNTAQAAGGVYIDGSTPTLARNQISGNSGQNGGGVYLSTTDAAVNGNRIMENSASIGGGLYIQGGQPNVTNNVVAKNQGSIQAAAAYLLSTTARLRHNTIADNLGGDGSGLFLTDLGVSPSNVDFINNILVNHTTGITLTAGNRVNLTRNLVNGNGVNWGGPGIVNGGGDTLTGDPGFAGGNDYHIIGSSIARDNGVEAGILIDFDNQARPADNGFDIGADEFVLIGFALTVQTIPDPVLSGLPMQFVIRALNTGNVDADAVVVATLPPEMTPSGIFTFNATIPTGEAWVQIIDAVVQDEFVGQLEAVVEAETVDELFSERVVANITVERPGYALRLTVEPAPEAAPRGGRLTYQLRLTNIGNLPITPTVEADLASQLSTNAALSWSPGAMSAGGTWTRSLNTNVNQNATGNVTSIFRALSTVNVSDVATVTVPVAEPGLLVRRFVTPSPAIAGEPITYTLFVTNTGNVQFTASITNHMPIDSEGRPHASPSEDQFFNVTLQPGQVFSNVLVVVVEPGYAGPLSSGVDVTTDTGLSSRFTDDLQSVLPTRVPSITAIRNGPWNDPNTWDKNRVPNASDIALVPEGIDLVVDGATNNPIRLTGLINHGNIRLECVTGFPMVLEFSDFLENTGTIFGINGTLPRQPGCAVEVYAGTILNDGLIRSGDGGPDGSDGGAILVQAQTINNRGQILGGDGTDATTLGRDGGNGGDAYVLAVPGIPGLLINSGLIAAGNGGNGLNGGRGGDAVLMSTGSLIIDGGEQRGGDGGEGDPGNDGDDGSLDMAAVSIWNNGTVTSNTTPYAYTSLGPPTVRGFPGSRALTPIFLFNKGIRNDTYRLTWTNAAGWTIPDLPTSLQVSSLRFALLTAFVTFPNDVRVGDENILRVTVTSQGNPAATTTREIRLIVGSGAGPLFLPISGNRGTGLFEKATGSGTDKSGAAAPAKKPAKKQPSNPPDPADITERLYLPVTRRK